MKGAILAGATVVACASAWYACSVYTPDLLIAEAMPNDAGAVGPLGCDPYAPPKATSKNDGTDELDLKFASRNLRIDRRDDPDASIGPATGFDLDQKCSCPDEPSCTPRANGPMTCDGTRGQDNAFAGLLVGFSSSKQFVPIDTFIERGDYAMLFRLQQYNGKANDSQVTFSVMVSRGLESRVPSWPDAGAPGGNDAGPGPRFDGTDRWTVDPETYLGGFTTGEIDCETARGCVAVAKTATAYVTEGVLVAEFAPGTLDSPVVIPVTAEDRPFRLTFDSARITAKVVKGEGDLWKLNDGTLGAGVKSNVMLHALLSANNPIYMPQPLCMSGAREELIKQVCQALDLPEVVGKGGACAKISTAIHFTAVSAHLGRSYHADDPDRCPEDNNLECPP